MTYLNSFQEFKVGDRVTNRYDSSVVFEIRSISLPIYASLPRIVLLPISYEGGPLGVHYITFCSTYSLSAATKAVRSFDQDLEDLLNE